MTISTSFITFINIAVIVYLLIGLYSGYKIGFILQIVKLISTIIALIAAIILCNTFADMFDIIKVSATTSGFNMLMNKFGNLAIWFVIIFILTKLLINLCGHIVNFFFKFPVLNLTNRIIGACLGGVLSAIMIVFMTSFLKFPFFSNGQEIIDNTYLTTVSTKADLITDLVVNKFIESDSYKMIINEINLDDSTLIEDNLDNLKLILQLIDRNSGQ